MDFFSLLFPWEEEEVEEVRFSLGLTLGVWSLCGENPVKDSSEREGVNEAALKVVVFDVSPT